MSTKCVSQLSLGLLKHIFCLAALSACAKDNKEKRERDDPQKLIFGVENEIKDYNISRSLDKNAFVLAELVTEALFYQKVSGELAPDLVTSYSRKGKLWSFRLRPSVFSNGKRLNCLDVRANIEEARNSLRPVKVRLRDISAVRCLGEVLQIETREAAPLLIGRMGHIIRIYDKDSLKERNPVGSGPYRISKREGKDIVLVPNPHSEKIPAYSEIRFRALRDPWLRDLALTSGNVDFLMENFSLLRLRSLQAKKGLRLYQNPGLLLTYLAFKNSHFSKVQRLALRKVIYDDKIVDKFWKTQAVATPYFFREGTTEVATVGGTRTKDSFTIPPPFSLEITMAADETMLNFLKEMALSLQQSKITLKLRLLEQASFMKRLNAKNFEAYLFYVDTSHVQNLEGLLHSTGSRLGIKDAKIDELFALAIHSEDKQTLEHSTEQLDRRIFDEAYLIPLYRPFRGLVARSQLQLNITKEGFWRDILRSKKVHIE